MNATETLEVINNRDEVICKNIDEKIEFRQKDIDIFVQLAKNHLSRVDLEGLDAAINLLIRARGFKEQIMMFQNLRNDIKNVKS